MLFTTTSLTLPSLFLTVFVSAAVANPINNAPDPAADPINNAPDGAANPVNNPPEPAVEPINYAPVPAAIPVNNAPDGAANPVNNTPSTGSKQLTGNTLVQCLSPACTEASSCPNGVFTSSNPDCARFCICTSPQGGDANNQQPPPPHPLSSSSISNVPVPTPAAPPSAQRPNCGELTLGGFGVTTDGDPNERVQDYCNGPDVNAQCQSSGPGPVTVRILGNDGLNVCLSLCSC